jgi:ElaB/YqjD/DUF883 family membrane-anchored ribosome-binding protein
MSEMYPTLGFNPCPGSPDHARSLAAAMKKAKDALEEANQLLARMQSQDPTWGGAASEAFSAHLKGRIGEDLAKGFRSMSTASDVMTDWSNKLQQFWDRAHAMEKEAAEVIAALNEAESKERAAARANNRVYETADEAYDAGLRYERAMDALNDARDKLQAIRDRAESMRDDEYEKESKNAAEKLEDAADFSAKEPGWLEKTGNFFSGIGKALVPQADDNLFEKTLKVVGSGAAVVLAPVVAIPAIGWELFGPDEVEHKIAKVNPIPAKLEPAAVNA